MRLDERATPFSLKVLARVAFVRALARETDAIRELRLWSLPSPARDSERERKLREWVTSGGEIWDDVHADEPVAQSQRRGLSSLIRNMGIRRSEVKMWLKWLRWRHNIDSSKEIKQRDYRDIRSALMSRVLSPLPEREPEENPNFTKQTDVIHERRHERRSNSLPPGTANHVSASYLGLSRDGLFRRAGPERVDAASEWARKLRLARRRFVATQMGCVRPALVGHLPLLHTARVLTRVPSSCW